MRQLQIRESMQSRQTGTPLQSSRKGQKGIQGKGSKIHIPLKDHPRTNPNSIHSSNQTDSTITNKAGIEPGITNLEYSGYNTIL